MHEITFHPSMVKPLRKRLNMTQESFAYIVGCGPRAISHYETEGKTKKIHRAVRDNMIRLMKSNGITTDQLREDKS